MAAVGIAQYAFSNKTKLTSVSMPATLKHIGDQAFYSCRALVSISYAGTTSAWGAVAKGSDWNMSTGSYTVYCTNGNILKANDK